MNKKFSHSIILCEQYQTGGGESRNIFDLTSTASVSTRVSHCYVGHSEMMVMSPCLRVHFGLMWLTGAECITDQWSSSIMGIAMGTRFLGWFPIWKIEGRLGELPLNPSFPTKGGTQRDRLCPSHKWGEPRTPAFPSEPLERSLFYKQVVVIINIHIFRDQKSLWIYYPFLSHLLYAKGSDILLVKGCCVTPLKNL